MTQEFSSWSAQLSPRGRADLPGNLRSWLQATFEEWGPLSGAEVRELAESERDVLTDRQLEAARQLIPALVADGRAAGMDPDVVLTLKTGDFEGLEVIASPEPGTGHYGASNGPLRELWLTEPELLAWLAEQVQEATMERDQVHCFVWPTCEVHQLGGHAGVEHGVAVWHCNGDGGHVLARIGEFGQKR